MQMFLKMQRHDFSQTKRTLTTHGLDAYITK